MDLIYNILKQYWGFTAFQLQQEDIIRTFLDGKDLLVILPTGGGKSICFQLPALCKKGVCIVISPLIALMKDQVMQLKKRRIPAEAIFSSMLPQEIDQKLDNCIYGTTKLLYVSPERLHTSLFQERIKKMTISFLVIDEAHCISQWGDNFRPAYSEIKNFQKIIPRVPTMALTATATKKVKDDIINQLNIQHAICFQESFFRAHLAYRVYHVQDKEKKLLQILTQYQEIAIIYVSTRKQTKHITNFLCSHGITATFYHAGLTVAERELQQDAWCQNKVRVMVATTAFGMGINKPDVGLVIHLHLPTSLETYCQEAGRAGRDGRKAYALLLYDQHDATLLKQSIQENHPMIDQIKKLYQHINNYYNIAIGTHTMSTYEFDLEDFKKYCNVTNKETYYALKVLEKEELIQLHERYYSQPSSVYIIMQRHDLYKFQVSHALYDPIIKVLLRLHGGELWIEFQSISEKKIAQILQISKEAVSKQLHMLDQWSVIHYRPQTEKPQLTFIKPRYPITELPLHNSVIKQQRTKALHNAKSVIDYVTNSFRCRAQLLLEYFDENSHTFCGICDFCLAKKHADTSLIKVYKKFRTVIINCLQNQITEVAQITAQVPVEMEKPLLDTLKNMLDSGELAYDTSGKLIKKS